MSTESNEITIIDETLTDIRKVDNYFNGTKLCTIANKKWNDYFRLKSTIEFIEELARSTPSIFSQ